ncbi:MAG: response regulator [Bacteroidota bacterium]
MVRFHLSPLTFSGKDSMKSSSPSRLQHVLLIDDNEIDNFINERIITSSGFSEVCTVKTSADEAIEYLNIISKDSKVPLPQVIFLDLNMPVKDGFAFLDEFNALAENIRQSCRIIVLSSSISPDDINRASANPYVIRYLNKPLAEKYLEAIDL